MIQDRTEGGQFAPKSNKPRQVRTIRLTDTTWEKMGYAADKRRITRADLVEQMAEDGVFDQPMRPGDDISYDCLLASVEQVVNDPSVTRKGKDKGAVRRGLEALLGILSMK